MTGPYTAVVYFHGIGNQRRFSEVSRFVEALDRYAFVHLAKGREGGSSLRGTRVLLEPSRVEEDEQVAYIRLSQYRRGSGDVPFRFYEGYWAPITAGRVTGREVALWIARNALAPVRLLLTPWRSHARLRRAALFRTASTWTKNTRPSRRTLKRLLNVYADFDGMEARRRYPHGRYRDFVDYLPTGTTQDEVKIGAKRWRRRYIMSLLMAQFVITTMLLTLMIGLATVTAGIAMLLDWASGTSLASEEGIRSVLEPTATNITAGVALLLGVTGVASVFRTVVGDVLLWATYEETDTRHEVRRQILASGVGLLRHVIADPDCSRVVVVGHSLGTTIAYDCLLALGQHYRARSPDDDQPRKFDQFVTMGSPIDTIHAVFESHSGGYHRYNQVFEDVRGDVGQIPFAFRTKPSIHWINFWDRADPISGPLYSPNQKRGRIIPVDNFEVNSFLFPSPGQAHAAYFENEHLMGHVAGIILNGEYSFRLPGSPAQQRLRTTPRTSRVIFLHKLMLALPWIILANIIGRFLGIGGVPADTMVAVGTGIVLLLAITFVASSVKGHCCSIWDDRA